MNTVLVIAVSFICLVLVFGSIVLERICDIREAELSAGKEHPHD